MNETYFNPDGILTWYTKLAMEYNLGFPFSKQAKMTLEKQRFLEDLHLEFTSVSSLLF